MSGTGLDLDGLLDVADEVLDGLGADVALVRADSDAALDLGDVEVLVHPVLLDDGDGLVLHALVACETVSAFEAYAAPSHGASVVGCSGFKDLVLGLTAYWTSHSVESAPYPEDCTLQHIIVSSIFVSPYKNFIKTLENRRKDGKTVVFNVFVVMIPIIVLQY